MATIKTRHSEFTGHVGPVSFTNGEAETELPAMVAHFKRDPERYEVTEAKPKRQRGKRGQGKGTDKASESTESAPESGADGSEAPEAGDESTEAADGDQGDKGDDSKE